MLKVENFFDFLQLMADWMWLYNHSGSHHNTMMIIKSIIAHYYFIPSHLITYYELNEITFNGCVKLAHGDDVKFN